MEGDDPELALVFYLFRYHDWDPERYYDKSFGAKQLIRALSSYEAELRNEVIEAAPQLASIQI